MRGQSPRGRQLRALEKNILKYRALQMVMLLFHVEDLKSFVLESVKVTQQLRGTLGRGNAATPSTDKNALKRAWTALVSDGILTQEERDDLQRIIDYRNDVAHRIHQLVSDLTAEGRTSRLAPPHEFKYDYDALGKLRVYRQKLESRMRPQYIMALSLSPTLFETAERTYQTELNRLERKIDQQLEERRKEVDALNMEFAAIDRDVLAEIFPDHPRNFSTNGRLTKRGVESCYRFFDLGVSRLAVAYLMGLSLRAIKRRYTSWFEAGGLHRPRGQLVA